MQIPQIRLESTTGQIGIKTNQAVNNISQPMADLTIEQPKAELQINTTPSKLTIDQTEARADMDLKSIARRTEEFAQQGKSDLLEGIARRAQQGDQLMKIENPGNPIASLAKTNSQKEMKEFGLAFIPSYGSVKINYEPSKIEINVKPIKPNINVQVNKPTYDYQPGNVDISLQRRNELKIDFEMIDIKA
ncbi:DUF6470 family protein [Metabacillus halosaccharovorans]|uniref:DUF6470 family protein n=1 Tax=Metabacillus halosaccharovorans TaxID=930124 RepID=A0ABT3DCU6_9BACI|nr:DUF6470 family protein [Metabacillus halosaccharovorans]MCV9884678.1 DUF6470 family protein [Metabacillus halosaccharovorans]